MQIFNYLKIYLTDLKIRLLTFCIHNTSFQVLNIKDSKVTMFSCVRQRCLLAQRVGGQEDTDEVCRTQGRCHGIWRDLTCSLATDKY